MSQPQVSIGITADDKTARGWASAEKRAGSSVKRIGDTGKDSLKATQDGIGRSSKGIVKSFSAIEQAGKTALGGGGIIGRMTAVRDIGILARGMGAASAEGITLEGTMVGVAGATAGLAGVAVIAAAAMWKLSDGWAKGANSLGNMSSLIGVSTAGLQKFAGAAERVGVDKTTATGALGSLSDTLNGAVYGKNPQAMGMLYKLGIKPARKANGDVDVEKMLPQLADAIAPQSGEGRRDIARALGIPLEALPAFTQGGRKLSAAMGDYGRNGAMMTDSDTKLGRDITERDVSGEQRIGKGVLAAQRWNATAVKAAGDVIIGVAKDASRINPPSLIGSADAQTLPAAGSEDGVGGSTGGGFGHNRHARIHGAGRFSAGQIAALARRAMPLVGEAQAARFNRSDAIALAANVELESGGRTHAREGGGAGPGRGLLQWTDRARRDRFQQIEGVDVEHADRATQWRHMRWETEHPESEARGWQRAHAEGNDPASVAAGYTRYVVRPSNKPRDSAERAAVADAITINLQFTGIPQGAGVTATGHSKHGNAPAISHAFNRE